VSSMRVCAEPNCGAFVEAGTRSGRCPDHKPREASSTARGYGKVHRRLRAKWKPRVEAGGVNCARCGRPIGRGEPFDLAHDE
jgi:hypothetical protein